MARKLSRTEIAAKGGKARAERMSKEDRTASAKLAANARWETDGLPRATHGDPDRPLKIGDLEIPCYVLDTGQRVLSGRGMQEALTLGQGHGSLFKSFLSRDSLKPFIGEDLAMAVASPIRFIRPGRGGVLAVGFEATLLADVCDVVLEARKAGKLKTAKEKAVASQCEILTRAFAKVGIIALVDEATGFQEDRARTALADILEKFISEELRKWVKTFPDEYFQELSRLRGINLNSVSLKKPQYIGHLTNNIVYSRLAPGVKCELQRITPKTPKGNRRHKFHQRLTEDAGHPKLREHLASVIALMKACDDWETFNLLIDKALPKYKEMPLFEGIEEE